MAKELPKVYANKIEKELRNNEKVYYGKNETPEKKEPKKQNKQNSVSIQQKINKIFGSSRYVYKADVDITLQDGGKISKKVIGRNRNQLITLDNELIDISSINDIEFSNPK